MENKKGPRIHALNRDVYMEVTVNSGGSTVQGHTVKSISFQ